MPNSSTPPASPPASSAIRSRAIFSCSALPISAELVPLSAEAIERAIELNGVAVEFNQRAFRWGRRAAVDPDARRGARDTARRSAGELTVFPKPSIR